MKRIAGTLIAACLGALASHANAAVCDVEVDRAMKLFVVNVDGQPFKGKRYLTYDDAAMLRDVLVVSGECVMPSKVAGCPPEGGKGVDVRLASTAASGVDRAAGRTRDADRARGFDACTYQ